MGEAHILVGRDSELALLRTRAIEEGSPAIVVGEPGIGKSALVSRLVAEARDAGYDSVGATCVDSQPPISFLPILAAFGEVARNYNIGMPQMLQRLETASLERLRAYGADERFRLYYDLSRTLDGLSEVGKHLFVFEDLHAADLDSLHLLHYLITQQSEVRFCFTARPGGVGDRERSEALSRLSQACTVISLQGLSKKHSHQLLGQICGPLHEHEANFLHQLTAGNPLFLDELGRHVRESGLLGESAVEDIVERLGMPGTLVELLDRDVAALPEPSREVIAAASCIGATFELAQVQALTDLDAGDVDDAIEAARRVGLVLASDDVDLSVMQFTNPLVRERAYRSLPPSRRRKLHGQLVHLDESGDALLTPEERAMHSSRAFAGAVDSRTVEACRLAAERSESLLAFQSAADFWRMALTCVPVGLNAERAELLRRQGLASRGAGNWKRAESALRRAYEMFSSLGNGERCGELSYLLGELSRFRLDLHSAIEWLRKCAGNDQTSTSTRAKALALMGASYVSLDQIDQGAAILSEALELVKSLGEIPPDVARWASFGLALSGKAEEAGEIALMGLASARRQGNSTEIANIACSLTFSSLHGLRHDDARQFVDLGDSLLPPLDTTGLIHTMSARTAFDAYEGRWQQVYEYCRSWLGQVRLAGAFPRATAMLVSAEACSILGRHDEALNAMDIALDNLESMRPLASLYKARMLLRADRASEARELLLRWGEQVLNTEKSPGGRAFLGDLVASLGERSLVGLVYERLSTEARPLLIVYTPTSLQRVRGKLAACMGWREQANRHFETAIEELEQGGARWELCLAYFDYAQYRGRSAQRRERKKSRLLLNAGAKIAHELGLTPPVVWLNGSKDMEVSSWEPLSPREQEILRHVRAGATNRDIAELLLLSVHTVDRHVENILSKLGASNRAEAAVKSAELTGMLSAESEAS